MESGLVIHKCELMLITPSIWFKYNRGIIFTSSDSKETISKLILKHSVDIHDKNKIIPGQNVGGK